MTCASAWAASWRAKRRADADVVVPVPDSGVPAAIGYCQESGIPFELGIIRNHYVGRTFIEPTQHIRELGVRLKHSANRAAIAGKRVVLVDDSLVRGTTSVKIVQHDARGRRHAKCTCASPRRRSRIRTFTASTRRRRTSCSPRPTISRRCATYIGADSLAFLSVDGIYRAMGEKGRNAERPQFTDHCFTGDYPTALTDRTGEVGPRQLSLLAEAS